jgi:hypothetical protein
MPVETVDEAVLRTITGDVLRPAVINAVIEGVLREFEHPNVQRDVSQLRAELRTVEREVMNLTKAIAAGGQLEPLLTELKARQSRSQELQGIIATWAALSPGRFDRKVIEHKVQAELQRWRRLLKEHVQDGRQFLREALTGPLRFAPERGIYRFEGEVGLGRLLGVAGLVAPFDSSPSSTAESWNEPFGGIAA